MGDLVVRQEIDWFTEDGDSWVVVDQMCGAPSYGYSLYSTHYFCRACCAELVGRVHHIRWCSYCGAEMSFLLDGTERPHIEWLGDWPYDLIRARFPNWCGWHGTGDEPWILTEDGGWSRVLSSCRLLDGHEGPHEFAKGRVAAPLNPIREP
jgi:hypothetical protein